MKTQPCMQLTVLQTNLLQAESANVNLCVNWSKLVDLLNICLWNNIPNLCEVAWEILPSSRVFSLAWLLAFTKLFAWLVCRVVSLFMCKQTSASRVVKFYCQIMISDHWGFACESSCKTLREVYVKLMREMLACEIFTCMCNMCVKCMWKVCEKHMKRVWK